MSSKIFLAAYVAGPMAALCIWKRRGPGGARGLTGGEGDGSVAGPMAALCIWKRRGPPEVRHKGDVLTVTGWGARPNGGRGGLQLCGIVDLILHATIPNACSSWPGRVKADCRTDARTLRVPWVDSEDAPWFSRRVQQVSSSRESA